MGQSFYDGEALRTGAYVQNREIDIVECEADDIQRMLFAIGLTVAISTGASKVVTATRY